MVEARFKEKVVSYLAETHSVDDSLENVDGDEISGSVDEEASVAIFRKVGDLGRLQDEVLAGQLVVGHQLQKGKLVSNR